MEQGDRQMAGICTTCVGPARIGYDRVMTPAKPPPSPLAAALVGALLPKDVPDPPGPRLA